MDVNFMNPFLISIINILETMAEMKAMPQKPFVKKDKISIGDVTGIIGMTSDQASGSMAISFTEPAIIEISSRMLGEKVEKLDETAADMVGEITNMVTGGAKRGLSEKGFQFDMAIPVTIVGRNHAIIHKTTGPVICMPFETDFGNFFMELCFNKS